jgi:hypothetical protein
MSFIISGGAVAPEFIPFTAPAAPDAGPSAAEPSDAMPSNATPSSPTP